MPTYRLLANQTGPTTATPTGSSGLVTGLIFEVTTGGCWLDGYWWWVCPEGQSTAAQTFTLWLLFPGANNEPDGELVPGTSVTSGELVAGQWNFVPLPQAVPLSIATTYMLETGSVGGVPVTPNLWGSGEPWAAGKTSGPLFAPPAGPDGMNQCPEAVGSNPAKIMAVYNGYPPNAYRWLDPQVTTEAPPSSSYRLWPGMPLVGATPKTSPDTQEQSAGTEFWLSVDCTLDKIWFWSPVANLAAPLPAATMLPGSCAIFAITPGSTPQGTMVQGTQQGVTGPNPAPDQMPDWRKPDGTPAAPGDGWVYCAYEGVTLPPGKYKTAAYCYGGGTVDSNDYLFFSEQRFYFGPDGTQPAAAPDGISNGPMYSPNVANASPAYSKGNVVGVPPGTVVPGNSTYQLNNSTNTGTFLYPDTFDNSDNGENRWVDVEVTPVPQANPPGTGTMLSFLP